MDSTSLRRTTAGGAGHDAWFDVSPDPMAVVGYDGTLQCLNPAALRLTGYVAGETPQSVFELIHPEDHPLLARAISQLQEAQPQPLCCLRVLTAEGTARWLECNAAPLDSESVFVIGRDMESRTALCIDAPAGMLERQHGVRERREGWLLPTRHAAEALLKDTSEIVQAIFDTSTAIMVVLDPLGRVTRINRAGETATGYSSGELTGRPFWEVLVPPAERAAVLDEFQRLSQGGFPSHLTNHWLTRDGQAIPIAWSNSVVADRDGAVRYVVSTGVDISGQIDAEARLASAREDNRRLLELVFDLVFMVCDDVVVNVNASGAKLLGAHAPAQLAGMALEELIHPDDYAGLCSELALIRADGESTPHLERRLIALDGRVLEVELKAGLVTQWRGRPALLTVWLNRSDRKLAKVARRAREHYFETLAKVAPVGIYQADTTGFVVYANRRSEEIVGHSDVLGNGWLAFVHPGDRARVIDAWADAVREGRDFIGEYRIVRPDAEVIWVLSQATSERNAEGELLGFIGTITDISHFKNLERQLREAEERARRVVDLSFDIVLVIRGQDQRVMEINPRGAQMLGGSDAGQFVGRPLCDLLMAEEAGQVRERIQSALANWQPTEVVERRLRRRDGACLELEGAAIPVMYRGEPAVYTVYRDISKRKAAERALRQRQHHFETLAKAAPVGIFQSDLRGECVYVNDRYLEITGYDYTETLGAGWREHIWDEDAPLVNGLWNAMVEGGARYQCEYRLRRRDGSLIWVLGQAAAEGGDQGEVLGFIGSITDITESKQNAIELQGYREHLEDMVKERTVELEALNHELEAFSYSVSHDLRAPLRAIAGFNSVLVEEYSEQLDEDGRFYLRRIQANSRQMSELIDDLLELSKVTQAELRREWVDISSMAEGILAELRMAAPAREVRLDIAPSLRVFGDPKLLRTLLHNLLGNAWKYTSREPVAHITVGVLETGNTRAFYVRDNGVGFDMSCATDLFRAFQRLHAPSEFEGTGIGLATVHRVVTRHGGKVWAESAEGQGATFYFAF